MKNPGPAARGSWSLSRLGHSSGYRDVAYDMTKLGRLSDEHRQHGHEHDCVIAGILARRMRVCKVASRRYFADSSRMNPHIAIAGGGASGLLLATALIDAGAAVTIVEPREQLGIGIAYSTSCPLHLLNAPASNMSGIHGDATHLLRWLAAQNEDTSGARFIPRSLYGTYLRSLAEDMTRVAGARFRHVRSTVSDTVLSDAGALVITTGGETIAADGLVVAVGNAEPAPWPRIETGTLNSHRYFRSAWADGAMVPSDPAETVVLLGTGLTAIDAVLGLRNNGHAGQIVMVSRRGLLPHEHRVFDSPPAAAPDAANVRDLIKALRLEARRPSTARGWRGAIDALRSQTNERWRALDLAEQRRFVRHVMPYWNVHRHRAAPAAAKIITELIADGTLRMICGRTGEIVVTPGALQVSVRLSGQTETLIVAAGRLINCSGPENDVSKLPNPLIRSLLERGYLVAHPLQIGAVVDPNVALIAADGIPSRRLYAIGPVRFGTLIETTAIPEIREQAHCLALTLTETRTRAVL
jgi:uncharacterized NAD(P)/FAD-binding protein YdhS